MARFAISPEGAAAMRALGKRLSDTASSLQESNAALEAKVSAAGDGLGVYESQILELIHQGQGALNSNLDSIRRLSQKAAQKALEIEQLAIFPTNAGASVGQRTGLVSKGDGAAGGGGPGGGGGDPQGLAPTGNSPRSLSRSAFSFQQDSDGNFVYDSPMEMNDHLYKTQGTAYSNIQGTCGLCSCANVMILSGVASSEKSMVDHAMGKGLCSFDKSDAGASGGTSYLDRQKILGDMGIRSHLEMVEFDGDTASQGTLDRIARSVFEGRGVIVSVDAGHFYQDARYLGGGHAVTVTSVKRSPAGDLLGFYICDSNQGTVYVTRDRLQRSLRATPINVTDSIIR